MQYRARHDARLVRVYASQLLELASELVRQSLHAEASEILNEMVGVLSGDGGEKPSPDWLLIVGRTSFGNLLFASGRVEEALFQYQAALEGFAPIEESLSELRWDKALAGASVFAGLAAVREQQGSVEEALSMCGRARRALGDIDPNDRVRELEDTLKILAGRLESS
jgi:tetratricopeptide (TPR) repeat protein